MVHPQEGRADKRRKQRKKATPGHPGCCAPLQTAPYLLWSPSADRLGRPGQKSHLAVEAFRILDWKEGSQKFLEAEGKLPPQKEGKRPEDAAANRCLRHSTAHPP